MRSKLLGTVIVVLGLGLGTSALALSSQSQGNSGDHNVQLHGSSFSLLSFLSVPSGGGWGNYQNAIERVVGAIRSGYGISRWQDGPGGSWHSTKPRDAGYVPEPGAVGVFSVGLLMAGALIRRLGRKG